jgi:hypothetical protein
LSTTPDPTRRGSRFLAAIPAVLNCEGGSHPCSARDLSRAGVLLEGCLPIPSDPSIRLTLSSPTEDLHTEIDGEVVHVHEQPDDEMHPVRLGIQFGPLDDEQADTIDRLVSRIVEGMAPAALEGLSEKSSLEEIRDALEHISPAHRQTLARRAGPNERAILRHDADPSVLDGLARNPTANLPEIRALLRRSDLLPATLDCIANDPRWAHDEEVRIRVATHPRVTFTVADRVVSRMNEIQLGKVVRRPGLPPGVRQKLMTRLSRKHRG